MEAMKDGSHLYEVERRAEHAARPGFRIAELQISSTQMVPWHFHSNVQDTFYVINGQLRLFDARGSDHGNKLIRQQKTPELEPFQGLEATLRWQNSYRDMPRAHRHFPSRRVGHSVVI